MKHGKILSLFAAALLGFSAAAFPPAAFEPVGIVAEAAVSGNWVYTVSSGKATITGYTGSGGSLTIPGTLGGKDVVAIGEKVFYYNNNLTSVVIPQKVLTIEQSAFIGCKKLQTVEIKGAAHLCYKAFAHCTALTNAKLHKNCTADKEAFTMCTALTKLKSDSAWYYNSDAKPVLTSNSDIRKLIRNVFTKSKKVKFVDDYCTALCDYIAATQTRPWMCEAVKARQLFRWLCDNCHFETDNTTFQNPENQLYSSVFLSYGLDGEGESVCSGYSKAYMMLLHAAGIEAYLVHSTRNEYGLSQMSPEELEYSGGHMWNMIKADGKYYQCDVSHADTDADPGRRYMYFLQTDSKMSQMHNYYYNATQLKAVGAHENHPYLSYNTSTGQAALNQCVYSYSDANYDGILDCDFNFDGIANQVIDSYILSRIAACDMNLNGVAHEAMDISLAVVFNQIPYHDTWLTMCFSMFPHIFGNMA